MLRAVGVSDAILGAGQLFLNISTAFFRLLTPRFRLDDVGQLNNQVEFSGTALLVDCVQNIEFSDQPLHGGVGLIHHREKRVLNDGDPTLRQDDILLLAPVLVVDPDLDVLGIPLHDFPGTHRFDLERAGLRVEVGIRGHDGHASLVQHGHDHVLDKGPPGLVQICLQSQTAVQT